MSYYEAGHWAVTTTDDAYGNADGANFEPEKADPNEPVWCVFDDRGDDEPVAKGMYHHWATWVANALNLFDAARAVMKPLQELEPPKTYRRRSTDLYDEVESRGFFVVCCKACDNGRPLPIPFATPEARHHWTTEHTLGTGHARYVMINPKPRSSIPYRTDPHPYQRGDGVNTGYELPCCTEPADAEIHQVDQPAELNQCETHGVGNCRCGLPADPGDGTLPPPLSLGKP